MAIAGTIHFEIGPLYFFLTESASNESMLKIYHGIKRLVKIDGIKRSSCNASCAKQE